MFALENTQWLSVTQVFGLLVSVAEYWHPDIFFPRYYESVHPDVWIQMFRFLFDSDATVFSSFHLKGQRQIWKWCHVSSPASPCGVPYHRCEWNWLFIYGRQVCVCMCVFFVLICFVLQIFFMQHLLVLIQYIATAFLDNFPVFPFTDNYHFSKGPPVHLLLHTTLPHWEPRYPGRDTSKSFLDKLPFFFFI